MPRNNRNNRYNENEYYNRMRELEEEEEDEEVNFLPENNGRNITANNAERIRRNAFTLVNTSSLNKNIAAPAARKSRRVNRKSRRANRKSRRASRANRK